MPLQRFRVAWTNFPGAPGISTHYLSTSVADYSPIRTFWQAVKDLLPVGTTLTYPSVVDIINEATGQLTGAIATTPMTASVSAAGASSHSGASGALVRWNTSAIVNGNRVVGRTFLVPIVSSSYDTNGSLSSSTITTVQTAANALIAALADGVKVWSRPAPTRAGAFFTALSATVPDLAVVLRSRRT